MEKIPVEMTEIDRPSTEDAEANLEVIPVVEPRIQEKTRPVRGQRYGYFMIPKLKARVPIFYGTREEQLKQGIGHVERTALPGENNNAVLSGHRDTVFRHLGKIEKGDRLIVETEAGEFTYLVRKIRIVDKENRTALAPKPKATLTVITCYPFGFVGHAPKRFVIIADLIAPKSLVLQYRKSQ
ncbi:class D sortase [Alkalihalobacterium chitinilyticum]|uniref:Class D sortase n=1 Tax=Alkalihalobacterium chitinilyticum TaxID=2980103 RepID=A0ABT5VH22_9BACI|nr:class D sortase [Alkalihalobacterium chitinilyticum]MDE5413504.1 class D sortase [Alkalihalobacterium chitinilyticum]